MYTLPTTIFFCYAHEDEILINKLKNHLSPLRQEHLIQIWYDRDIRAGTEWEREIENHLEDAQIFALNQPRLHELRLLLP
jgi:hypothetical protein